MSTLTCPHCHGAFTVRLVALGAERPRVELRPRKLVNLPPVMGHYRPVYANADAGPVIGFECVHCEGAVAIGPGGTHRAKVLRARTAMIGHLRKEHAAALALASVGELPEENGTESPVNVRQWSGDEFDSFVRGLDLRGGRT